MKIPRWNLIRLASTATRRKRVFSQFALDRSGIDAMGREVARTYVASYEARLRQLARQMGSSARVRLTEPEILKRVQRDSMDAGAGIVHTYNRDLRRFVKGLDKGMTQAQMSAAVREWRTAREGWKSKQIAKTTGMLARNDADRDVIARNEIAIEKRATPRSAAESKCQAICDRGWIPADDGASFPLHPNCVHSWEYRAPLKEAVAGRRSVWIGDTVQVRRRRSADAA